MWTFSEDAMEIMAKGQSVVKAAFVTDVESRFVHVVRVSLTVMMRKHR